MTDPLRPHDTYLAGLTAGELRFQRCGACSLAVFHPRVVCNHCGNDELPFEVSGGLGTVYSTTAVSNKGQPSGSVALVDLDEGFRMMSTVIGVPAEDVTIGQRVRGEVEPATPDTQARFVFRPDGAV